MARFYINAYRNGLYFKEELDTVEIDFEDGFDALYWIYDDSDVSTDSLEVRTTGNNFWVKDSCYQFRFVDEDRETYWFNSFVEMQVTDDKIRIYKHLDLNDFTSSNELITTLGLLDRFQEHLVNVMEERLYYYNLDKEEELNAETN